MPEVPAMLANVMEPWFARATRVTGVEDLAPRLKRVRFEGGSLRGLRFRAGQEVEFRVSETAFRHYTPSFFDGVAGALEVVFFLHGHGPGSHWASGLREGSTANVLGPGGKLGLDPFAATHVLLGDETSIGLFAAMGRSLPPGSRAVGAVELDAGCERWPGLAGSALDGVARGKGPRGAPLRTWLEEHPAWLEPRRAQKGDTTFYLSGHAGSIVELRRWLVEERGIPKGAIRTKAYWADGKRGL
ncbi:siderophore-interacting protein [Chondromyces crocatus]|uniref:Oxidoreductase n=1 Tax=Chondromyces crocatus TaxID=52 RepID=A0A0K1E833_CHOCO|nr:siderophore-interacting protein [Chondromyces crocatus]AKT36728.1 oxidoreductase [Chondromyces crocatus]